MCRGLRGEVERKLRGVEDFQMAEEVMAKVEMEEVEDLQMAEVEMGKVEMAEVEDLQMAEVEMGKRKRWENEAMRGERRRKGIAAGKRKAPLLRSLDLLISRRFQ